MYHEIKSLGIKEGMNLWFYNSGMIDYYQQRQGIFIFVYTCFSEIVIESLILKIIAWILIWAFYEFYFEFGRQVLFLNLGVKQFKLKQGDKFL